MKNPQFDITHKHASSKARVGRITTQHGIVETPAFIFCATKASIKGLSPQQIKDCGSQIILSNTYHLMVNPGSEIIKLNGGLQKFTGWNGPMFTDSGGFQIFSLGHGSVANEIKGRNQLKHKSSLLKITKDGAQFQSYLDGSKQMLTPEKSLQIQADLGADLIVMFDECTPYNISKQKTYQSMLLSHDWGKRSLAEFNRSAQEHQGLYGVVQGGVYESFRQESVDFNMENDFFGIAIGGSLGANKEQMYDIVAHTTDYIGGSERPIHLLGIGGVRDILNNVVCGIDTFDCVHPTRLARHGGALVAASYQEDKREHLNLLNAKFKYDTRPIMEECLCSTCQTHSRSYLHYLFKAKEMYAGQAITIHNISFMNKLFADIREGIKHNKSIKEMCQYWIKE